MALDVLEPPADEDLFVTNSVASLTHDAVAVIGAPSIHSQPTLPRPSKGGHRRDCLLAATTRGWLGEYLAGWGTEADADTAEGMLGQDRRGYALDLVNAPEGGLVLAQPRQLRTLGRNSSHPRSRWLSAALLSPRKADPTQSMKECGHKDFE